MDWKGRLNAVTFNQTCVGEKYAQREMRCQADILGDRTGLIRFDG